MKTTFDLILIFIKLLNNMNIHKLKSQEKMSMKKAYLV